MKENYYGYAGKILRINLSDKQDQKEPLDMETARRFIGGRGFNTKVMYEELKPGIDPRGEKNKYIVGSGPLGGTLCPFGTRINVSGKSPQTGIFGDTNAGAHFAADMKFAGYDQIIIEGKSDSPVYIFIDDDRISYHDGSHLWGKNVREANKIIREELKDPSVQILCTGMAADYGANIAGTFFNLARAAARTGTGSILASKNVKAIAVRGTGSINVFDPERFYKLNKQIVELIRSHPQYVARSTMGTPQNVRWLNEKGFLTVNHFLKGYQPTAYKWEGETLRDHYTVKSKACFSCPLHCSRYYVVKDGNYVTEGEGPEYEAMACFASRIDADDPEFMLYCNTLCNEFGLDEIAVGELISWLMELNERGIISSKDCDGLDLSWGNKESTIALIEKIARREGIGDVLADGVKKAAERIGRGSMDYAMEVKGLEIINGEPRGMVGYGLTYAVSDRGADHLRAEPYFELKGDPQIGKDWFGIPETALRLEHHGKGVLVKWSGEWCAVSDALEVCKNTLLCMDFLPYITDILNAAVGWDMTQEELQRVGERMVNLERCFNVREGIRRPDDRLPSRFINEPMECGGRETQGNTVHLEYMLEQYYRARNWDPRTGIPNQEKLLELGLGDVNSGMEKYRNDDLSRKVINSYKCCLEEEEISRLLEELEANKAHMAKKAKQN